MIHRNLAVTLGWAGGYAAGVVALQAAEAAGFLPHDGRPVAVFTGIILALYANYLPKALGKLGDAETAMRWQSVLRVSAWGYTVGGLAFAVTSLLPLPEAVPLSIIGAATAYVLGYSAWAFMERPSGSQPRLDA